MHYPPELPKPTVYPDDLLLVPLEHIADRGLEKDVGSSRISTIISDAGSWIDTVVLALTHLLEGDIRGQVTALKCFLVGG